ncbi:FadR/GntR family transcriptional regulator [Mycoplana rhizolycopersici]|jgi:GntR family transcriptional repressor for pyruvate dehydrogenase complex|uniref:FadR family transcriptional regulator n=1 Tax=Mycoplana rhizolycopersici TaxID=2746702 RepID=A0ABX2QGF0_9HYPH|nr:FCD domain-containing protein [Rhizobium rhizolycopersici]NVP56845.1 FadR family transcriptional regulator [Rhizobium rhizolycopersici]
MIEASDAVVLTRLRDFLSTTELADGGRLPPERELAQSLDVGRAALRKALATLQAEGTVWRHVGKGTFTGERPIDTVADINAMVQRTNPLEVMAARIAFEPEVARYAALHATASQVAEMRSCVLKAQQAPTWRQYEQWDNKLHRTIGEASQNSLLLGLLDTLNAVRRAVNWGRLRDTPVRPPADHHSFEEHARIVEAIADRDGAGAVDAMRRHLRSVETHMRNRI